MRGGGGGAFVSRNHNSRKRKAGTFVSIKNDSRVKNQGNQRRGSFVSKNNDYKCKTRETGVIFL